VFTAAPPAPPPAAARLCRISIGSATSPGRVRERNEDRFLVQHLTWAEPDHYREIALVIVADGVGGEAAGDRAAAMVMSQVGSYLGALMVSAVSGQLQDASPERLTRSINESLAGANRNVFEAAKLDPACRGMAATAAAAIVWDGQVLIGHVGDCRVYHHHAGQLTQVTKDQTLVERMVELGTLTKEEAANHPARNQVTQAMGKSQSVHPASYRLALVPGDCLVVASDGLHAHVDTRMLASAIRKTGYSADILANHLVELANQGGGTDNCTAVALLAY
jgi:protein phosphatase